MIINGPFTHIDDYGDDLLYNRFNVSSDTIKIRLVTEIVTVTTASDAVVTDVAGNNYPVGGLVLTTTIEGTKPQRIVKTSTTTTFAQDASGFTGCNSAVIDVGGRIVAFLDMRNGGAVGNTAEDVVIALTNGTDLFQMNRAA